MPNPYASQAKSGNASKLKAMTGKASGGAVYSGEKSTFATGGAVSAPGFARGGKTRGKHHKGTHINIAVVAPHGKGADPAASMPPAMPPGMPPGAPMAPPPGMGPPGAPPGGPPPGMPPMKRGGAAYAKGGKVPMKAGAGTGPGRLEKKAKYGPNPK